MSDYLKELVERSKGITMNAQQEAAQRRSFAYGNTKIENDRITRDMVAAMDEKLNSEK